MCIIAVKKSGIEIPNDEIIRNCWHNNSDGAGLMWKRDDGKIIIEKGFMKLKSLMSRIKEFSKEDYMVIHFRKSTSAGINPENTHPYPLDDDYHKLRSTNIECDQALVHNGVLGRGESDLSDTAVFVRDYLSDSCIYKNLESICVKNLINEAVGSDKVIIMDSISSSIFWFGHFQYDDKSGLYFSNSDYKDIFSHGWERYYTNRDEPFGKRNCPICREYAEFDYYLVDEIYCKKCFSSFTISYNKDGVEELVNLDDEYCPDCGQVLIPDEVNGIYSCMGCTSTFVYDNYNDLFKIHDDYTENVCPMCGTDLTNDFAKGIIYCEFCSYEEQVVTGGNSTKENECPDCGTLMTKSLDGSYICTECGSVYNTKPLKEV